MKLFLSLILLLPVVAPAQVFTFTREEMLRYTAKNPFERFEDGRPKVPDAILEKVKGLSAEEVWAVLPGAHFPNQYEGNWRILHPDRKLVGRAVTAQFMPMRPDVADISEAEAKAKGLGHNGNQRVIDTLKPGDVVFGDREGVYFIPPELVKQVVDKADETHVHDEWTKMKLLTGKYKSSEIYPSPSDPALKKEYEEYKKQKLGQ